MWSFWKFRQKLEEIYWEKICQEHILRIMMIFDNRNIYYCYRLKTILFFIIIKNKDIDQLKVELVEKEDALKENIKQIAELDETILIISDQQNELLRKMKKVTKPEKTRTDILNRLKNYKKASIEPSDVEKQGIQITHAHILI